MGARIVTEDAAVGNAHHPVIGFDLGAVEDSVTQIGGAARIQAHGVGGVMGVGRVDPVEDALHPVGPIIAVGILDEPQIWRLHEEHAVVVKGESGRPVQVVEKVNALVGFTVPVRVFENKEAVAFFAQRFALRIIRPNRDPKASLRIKGHLHWIGQLGKFGFGCKQGDLAAGRHLHPSNGFLAAEIRKRSVRVRPRFVGLHFNGRRQIVVCDIQVAALRDRPDPLVPIRRHDVAHLHLAKQGVPVHHPVKLQMRATAVNVEAVDGSVALEELPVLVVDRGPQGFEVGVADRGFVAKQGLEDDRRNLLVTGLFQVDSIERQRFRRLLVKRSRRSKKVD